MPPRSGRLPWATLVFLVLFTVLLVAVSHWYLLPALETFRSADAAGRQRIKGGALLVLTSLLLLLVGGIVVTFRFGRFFFPRETRPREKTEYVDAWAESGRRLETPGEDEPDADPDRETDPRGR